MMLSDTCPMEKKCHLWKKHGKDCPNFIETTWTPANAKRPVVISDCAPKRTMLLIMEIRERLIGTQKSTEEMRNEASVINRDFGNMVKYLQGKALEVTDGT